MSPALVTLFGSTTWKLLPLRSLSPSVLRNSSHPGRKNASQVYSYSASGFALPGSRRGMATNAPTRIKIDVTSDSICPFCFIGKRKLDKAIELVKANGLKADFDIEFHPYLLDPTLREDVPDDKQERYARKFGEERVQAMHQAMAARGKQNGINFSFGGKVRQTTDSHRLLALAYEKGGWKLQADLIEKLFSGYFEQEKDIGDRDFLASQAVSSGLFANEEEAKAWLATDAKREEVRNGIEKAQQMGITGVPFFVFNNKYAISGAEDSEVFLQVFERILAPNA